MKSFLQLLLIAIMIIIAFFFYYKYFLDKEVIIKNIEKDQTKLPIENIDKEKKSNNLITKLKYKVQLSKDGEYEINAKSSEISYINNIEVVLMNEVTAIFLDNKKRKITVKSDKAKFNTISYDTNFQGNIEIKYFKNIIKSNKLDFTYLSNDITIYENVVYIGNYGSIKADNIRINLQSKNIDIFMDNPENKVRIMSNQ
tara:strand:+ start:222 stop:818 length:597 start_codon:yes stop_codon:yes gene_type:complete